MSDDTRDKVIALEVQVRNLEGDVKGMAEKVDEMHAILLQAKGARYVIVAAAALGGAVASFAVKLLPWSPPFPK